MNDRYIYLAAPYSDPDPEVRAGRFHIINEVVANMMRKGWTIYSPISHNHPIALNHDLPTGWDFWGKMDRVFIKNSMMLAVLTLPGWRQSHGVKEEIKIAREFKIPIVFVAPDSEWILIVPRRKDARTMANPPVSGE